MELEDAMTIFSYASPYPVQLSLLPTPAAAPAPVPMGRRSRSLDQLETRRSGEVKHAKRSQSDRREHRGAEKSSNFDLQAGHLSDRLVQAADRSSQVTPAIIHAKLTSSPTKVCNSSGYVNEHTHSAASTDQATVDEQLLSTSSTMDDEYSFWFHDVATDALTTRSPGGSDSLIPVVGADLDKKRGQSDKKIVRGESGQITVQYCNEMTDKHSDYHVPLHHYQIQQQQQQQNQDVRTVDQMALEKAIYSCHSGDVGVQLSVEEKVLGSVERHESVRLATDDPVDSEVFYDVDINLDDINPNSDTTDFTRQRPAGKKKRGLLGSLKTLLRSSSSSTRRRGSIEGGAVPYVPPEEDTTEMTTTSKSHIVQQQSPETSASGNHNPESRSEINTKDQQKCTELSVEFLGTKSEEFSTWIDEVFTAVSNTETHVADVSESGTQQQCSPDPPEVEQSQTGFLTDATRHIGPVELEDINLVTFDARTSQPAALEELSSSQSKEIKLDDILREFDIICDDLNDPVVDQVNESATPTGVKETVPAIKPQGFEEERSYVNELEDASDSLLLHSQVLEVLDKTPSTPTSVSTDPEYFRELQKVKDKRSSEKDTTETPDEIRPVLRYKARNSPLTDFEELNITNSHYSLKKSDVAVSDNHLLHSNVIEFGDQTVPTPISVPGDSTSFTQPQKVKDKSSPEKDSAIITTEMPLESAYDAVNFSSTKFEEPSSTESQKTRFSEDTDFLNEREADRLKVTDKELLEATDDESQHVNTTEFPDVHGTVTEHENSTTVPRSITEVDAELASIQPPPPPPLDTDEDNVTTPVIRNDVEVQIRATTNLISAESNNSSLITDADRRVKLTGDSCEQSADFDVAVRRPLLESGLFSDLAAVDEAGQREEIEPTDDQALSEHCLVVIETPITTSGGTSLAPVNDDSVQSNREIIITESDKVVDEDDSLPLSDAELPPWKSTGHEIQHLDVICDGLKPPVVIQVIEPTTAMDVIETVPTTSPQVFKDERSSNSDATNVTSDMPSVVTKRLAVIGSSDETKTMDDSEYCMVDLEAPITSFTEIVSAPLKCDHMEDGTSVSEKGTEASQIDNRYEEEVEREENGSDVNGHSNVFSEQSPAQNVCSISAASDLQRQDNFPATSADSHAATNQTSASESAAECSFVPSSSAELNVDWSEIKLQNDENNREAARILDSRIISHRRADLPDKRQLVESSEEIRATPIVSNPLLVMGGNSSILSGVVGGERILQTAENFHEKRTSRPAAVAVMGNVKEWSNRTFQQPRVGGVPLIRGNHLPMNSPDCTSPTTDHSTTVHRPASPFTFTVQRPVKLNPNYGRSLSTGRTYNTGSSSRSGGEKPAYTFVLPTTVRRRSFPDPNNNELSTRHPSASRTVIDGRRFDTKTTTVTTTRYTAIDPSKYNPRPAVHRTGSVEIDDRKRINPVWQQPNLNGRMSESTGQLQNDRDTTLPIDFAQGGSLPQLPFSSITADTLKDKAVSGPSSGYLAGSLPELQSTSLTADDSCQRHEVMTSYHRYDDVVSHDMTRSHDVECHGEEIANVHDFGRSESCLDVTESCHALDDDDRQRFYTEKSSAQRSERQCSSEVHQQGVNRLTLQLSDNDNCSRPTSGGSIINKRRPRRSRIVRLSHSSLTSSSTTTDDHTPPT